MIDRMRKPSFAAVLVAVTLMVPATAAVAASDISIAVSIPESVAVGNQVELITVLTSAGEPIDGAVVSLTYQASFAGVSRAVELDRETTGAEGTAVLSYEQRASDNGEMRVEYLGPDDLEVAPVVFSIVVRPGAEQQHRSEPGLSIWFLGGWVVIAVIMTVWALIVFSAFQLVAVGRRASHGQKQDRVEARVDSEQGSAWVSVALAMVAVITAVGMVVVYVRTPLTHGNIDTPEVYDRTPIVFIGEEAPYLGPGLDDPSLADSVADGQLTYFQFGCGGCHGLTGAGGVVAPELVGEVGSTGGFTEDVREGPKNMPPYSAEVLSDDQLAKVHAFLKQGGD
jgi:hypothetical protein